MWPSTLLCVFSSPFLVRPELLRCHLRHVPLASVGRLGRARVSPSSVPKPVLNRLPVTLTRSLHFYSLSYSFLLHVNTGSLTLTITCRALLSNLCIFSLPSGHRFLKVVHCFFLFFVSGIVTCCTSFRPSKINE